MISDRYYDTAEFLHKVYSPGIIDQLFKTAAIASSVHPQNTWGVFRFVYGTDY
jgi:hypothetical protein